jgi:hypothetical protein
MKKIICICSVLFFSLSTTFAYSAKDVSEKVMRIFKSGFPDVKEPSWHTYDNCYEVYFKKDNCATRICYDFDGNLLSTLCHYDQSKLPAFIRAKVTGKYAGKSIFGVTELTTETDHTYHIVLQDDKYWYNVKADDSGRVRLENKFKKA